MLKIGKWSICTKFETFDGGINIEHKHIPKYILSDGKYCYITTHNIESVFCIYYYHFAVLVSLKKFKLHA